MGRSILALTFLVGLWAIDLEAADVERDPIRMLIIATNPSKGEPQEVMIKEPIPPGLTRRADILVVPPELEIEFDSKTSLFYVVAKKRESDGLRKIRLEANEIERIFVVELADVWYIPDSEMTGIENQSQLAMGILAGSEYEAKARELVDAIADLLTDVRTFQDDDSLRKKEYIAGHWNNKEKVKRAIEILEELERYVKLWQAKKEPDMMKTDSEAVDVPSRYATWLVIFIILVFLGILTGAFYFVWQRRTHLLEEPLSEARRSAFPESGEGSEDEES